jgi:hypothetical protein
VIRRRVAEWLPVTSIVGCFRFNLRGGGGGTTTPTNCHILACVKGRLICEKRWIFEAISFWDLFFLLVSPQICQESVGLVVQHVGDAVEDC